MDIEIGKILLGLMALGISVASLVIYIVLVALNPRHVKRRWKSGLVLGFALVAMLLPGSVFSIVHFDLSAFPEEMRVPMMVSLGLGVGLLFLKAGWYMILYVVAIAEWHKVGSGGPLGGRARSAMSWSKTAVAFTIGALVAVLSLMVFSLLEVGEGDFLVTLRRLFPSASSASPLVTIPVVSLMVTACAISEELVFRGGLMALAIRKSQNRPVLRHLGGASLPEYRRTVGERGADFSLRSHSGGNRTARQRAQRYCGPCRAQFDVGDCPPSVDTGWALRAH